MPKRARELSARRVETLREDGRYAVGGVVGLYLSVRGCSRTWVLRIKVGGRRRELGLGSYPEVSLAVARDKAWELRRTRSVRAQPNLAITASHLAEAPKQETQVVAATPIQRETHSFEFCARTYVAAQAPGWKSDKHAKQWLATLETYAFPVIGSMDVADIATSHVVEILAPIWSTKTETATRLRGRIESILDWAAHREYRAKKNPAAWKGNLKHELPSPTMSRPI